MYYPGSKERIAGAIIFYILKQRNRRPYVEPFLGGANIMSKVPYSDGVRYGNDINSYLIQMWRELQKGWIPPEFIDEQTYQHIKENKEKYDPALTCYAGFVCSFNSFWFSGYRGLVTRVRTDTSGNRVQENQQQYARNHLLKQIPNMTNVVLSCSTYENMYIPDNSIIYCDPPYFDVSQPYIERGFDSTMFWEWVRFLTTSKHNYIVYITEYTAPDDFVSIFEERINPIGGTLYGSLQPNRLFVHSSQIDKIDTTPPQMPRIQL